MKLSFILLIVTFFQANAMTFAQKVSMKVTKVPLNTVFYKFSKQTGYNFVADANLSKKIRTVSVDLRDVALKEAIEKCFSGIVVDIVLNEEHKTVFIKEAPRAKTEKRRVEAKEVQQHSVSGTIRSPDNQPMQGVSIAVQNKSTRTFTDEKGRYSITADSKDTLSFSFIGHATQLQAVKGRSSVNVILQPVEEKIDDVVVIGYGEVKREDLTGSVGIVKVEDIKKAPVARFDEALAGRIAGVQVTSDEGQPGSPMNIVIRGGNSLTQSNDPLYVVDGFPMEDFNTAALNPQDIKSITILKDASATAIYGARGANGVVVIETNDGQVGDTRFTYDTYYGRQQVTKKMELMNPYEFVKYQAEFNPAYAEQAFFVDGMDLEDYRNVEQIDWQDKLFRNAGVQNHSLSANGGTDKTKFSISGNLINQDGAVINSGFDRVAGRVFFNHKANNKLTFNLQANYAQDKSYGDLASTNTSTNQPYASFLLYRTWGYRPLNRPGSTTDIEDEFLDPDADDARFNPVIDYSNSQNNRINETFNVNGNAWYKILPNLTLKVKGGYSKRTLEANSFYNSLTSRGSPLSTSNTKGVNGSVIYTNFASWVNENTLTYRPKLKKGQTLTALLGWTLQGNSSDRFGLAGEHVPNELLGIYGLEEGTPGANTAFNSENMLMSYLGRIDYAAFDKYLFTASFRADGSSKFAKENRWSYFPSAAFAWKVKNESFLENVNAITDAKLRASYGLTGNNRIGDFALYSQMNLPYSSYYSFGNTVSQGIQLTAFGNKQLKWETTRQLDLGLDLSLFKNRIGLTLDFYKKITTDLLLRANVPYSSGYSTIFRNVGEVSNSGIEFTLNTINIQKDNFQWESNFNISFNRNKILALTEDESRLLNTVSWGNHGQTNLFIAEVGGPIAQFYGLLWDGMYQIDDFTWQNNSDLGIPHNERTYLLKPELPSNGSTRTTIQPGDIKYVDVNGDGIVNTHDNVIIGRGIPIHTGGFNNNLTYRNWSLNVLFQWSYGNDIMNANRIYLEGNEANRSALNQFATYADRWTYDNQDSQIPRAKGQGPTGYYSSRTLEDGSYLRLKTIALNYRLPSDFSKRLKLNDVNIYASGQNLFTWTNYSGMDPEVSTRNSALTPGLDYSSYPRMRIYTMGLKVTF